MTMIIINQIFLHHILKNIAHRDRDNLNHLKYENLIQKPTDIQNPQQIDLQNPFNIQSFQPIQPQNPMSMLSYQPTQMQNEITKNQHQTFHKCQMPQNHYK